ncbi:hypothetical protein ADL21_00335 [Streptomyces albus subsp. albus]|nr:hypothetical protein ADL21_00335 [Streptomyces albus subsp. albus]
MEQVTTAQLRPPDNRVDPRTLVLWRTRLWLTVSGLAIASVALISMLTGPRSLWPWVGVVLLLAAAVPLVHLLTAWWFHLHRWEVTGTAVYVRNGWLRREWGITPLSGIQTVDVQRGPLQQRCGLATVLVTTASAMGDLRLQGLDHTAAEELAERLTHLVQATPGDAT